MAGSNPTPLSVSELNQQARSLLEQSFAVIQVEGEISNFVCPSSGHWYFTLKDERAQVRCALFRNRSRYLKYRPQNGDRVLLRAKVSLYEGRGEFQLIGEYIEPAGAGDLQAAFEALKQKLQLEGLFEAEHKHPLPAHPQHIGVITSPTGAAIQDILSVLQRRSPATRISLFPAAVQGDEAAQQLRQALKLANRLSLCDVLIIGRGGGSAEDLCAFNDEALARDIFASPIPVVSAVGHEIDFSICDFVADVRAPTPSAAAELLSPDQQQLQQRFQQYQRRFEQLLQQYLLQHQHQLNALQARLRHPGQRLQEQAQRLDSLELRLRQSSRLQLDRSKLRLTHLEQRLSAQKPDTTFDRLRQQLQQYQQRLQRSFAHQLQMRRQQLAEQVHALNSLSPLATLDRGFSITQTVTGEVVSDPSQVSPGDTLRTRLAHGQLISRVSAVEPDSPQPELNLQSE